jgi:hypothetical protein
MTKSLRGFAASGMTNRKDNDLRRRRTQKRTKTVAEERASQDETTRFLCNLFAFWLHCSNKRCRRERACTGNAHACHNHHWWSHSEEDREWARAWLTAALAGKTVQEAFAVADASQEARERLRGIAVSEPGRPSPSPGANARARNP